MNPNLHSATMKNPHSTIQAIVEQWEAEFLDINGRYVGESIPGIKRGQYIPITERYSTMLTHNWETRGKQMNHES